MANAHLRPARAQASRFPRYKTSWRAVGADCIYRLIIMADTIQLRLAKVGEEPPLDEGPLEAFGDWLKTAAE